MAFLVYIVVFSICIWFGNQAAKLKHPALAVVVAAVLPFLLIFVFSTGYELLAPLFTDSATSNEIAGERSLNVVLYAFLATPGALISVIVCQMVRNQPKPEAK
ncbi:MAG: hypothetical protein LAT53_08240 [Idiomarina sp.]|nr:hypothetical protein [Idiomarina sp.]